MKYKFRKHHIPLLGGSQGLVAKAVAIHTYVCSNFFPSEYSPGFILWRTFNREEVNARTRKMLKHNYVVVRPLSRDGGMPRTPEAEQLPKSVKQRVRSIIGQDHIRNVRSRVTAGAVQKIHDSGSR